MTKSVRALLAAALLPACGGGDGGGAAPAGPVSDLALVTLRANTLTTYSANAPGQPLAVLPVGGVDGRLLGIDYRPSTGQLLGVSSAGRLYSIDLTSGAATAVGGPFAAPPAGGAFGLSVDPGADIVRVVGDGGQRLAVNPATGAAAAEAGLEPGLVALAHAVGGPAYALDRTGDRLARVTDAGLSPVGPLGLDVTEASLDIAGAGAAYAAMKSGGVTRLYAIDLATGAAASLGVLGDGGDVEGLALASLPAFAPAPGSLVALKGDNLLLNYAPGRPELIAGVLAVTGVTGELRAIDYRPASGELLGLSDEDRLYVINPVSGAATPVGRGAFAPLSGTAFGFSVDPAADEARIVSETDENRALGASSGEARADAALAYVVGDANAGANPRITALAHGGTTTYGIDVGLDVLTSLPLPALGQLATLGALGVNASSASFDIAGGQAYAALESAGVTRLYSINLSTGAATPRGTLGSGGPVHGLAVRP